MAPARIRKPRPVLGQNPGYKRDARPGPTGPKKPWSRAEEIGHRVGKFIDSLNPFD